MVIKNSIRQLMRTPVKTLFFLLLLACTITFFVLGYSLRLVAQKNIERIERSFTTIGTVEQKPLSPGSGPMTMETQTGTYFVSSRPQYGSTMPLSVLDFKGADYILKPEKRPLYIAYDPGYVPSFNSGADTFINRNYLIIEAEPVKDCQTGPNLSPVRLKVKKVLLGTLYDNEIYFCDQFTEKTENLYAGKTYIMLLDNVPSSNGYQVYIPDTATQTSQVGKDGKLIPDTASPSAPWDEVTDDFFNTPRGKRWQAVMDGMERMKHEIPVVPTGGTKLLMAFYTGDARIVDGRDISAEEYRNGEKVCLIQSKFALNNHLTVGGSLRLPLYYADYSRTSSQEFTYQDGVAMMMLYHLLNAKGEGYSAFADSTYKIVGIYSSRPFSTVTGYEMGYNAVVVPFASVKNSDENNIIATAPMLGCTTSFQIPNGSIDKYKAAWDTLGISGLNIKLYDQGYSKIKAGLETMMNTATILFAVGAVTTLFVVILFCYLFITKQRKRTAIERSLGLSKRLCAASLLAGLLLVVAAAYIAGAAAGYGLTSLAVTHSNVAGSRDSFDMAFSSWASSADANKASGEALSADGAAQGVLAAAAVVPVALVISLAGIIGNLNSEPLKMLGEKER